THVVLLLLAREVLPDDAEQLRFQFFHLAGRQLRPVVGQDQLQAFPDVVAAAAATEDAEHQRPPNRRRKPAISPPRASSVTKGISWPRMRPAMFLKALPAPVRLPVSRLAGEPMLVDTTICSSSGTMPMSWMPSISSTSFTSSMSPRLTISGRSRFTMSRTSSTVLDSSRP